jgi:hypothetical protein
MASLLKEIGETMTALVKGFSVTFKNIYSDGRQALKFTTEKFVSTGRK